MITRTGTILATLGCVFLASCYPYPENKRPQGQPPANDAEMARRKADEETAKRKKEEEAKRKEAENRITNTTPGTEGGDNIGGGSAISDPKPKEEPKKTDYAFASKVPGKEGFVFSPYNNKVVDVRDIPSGTLVADPTYSASEKKYFRVP